MKPVSLFEREMRSQVAAAEAAVTDAASRSDPLLLQAARNNLDALLSLAHRNGISIDSAAAEPVVLDPAVSPAV